MRRDFIALVGGGAVLLPLAARAQPARKVPKIGILFGLAASDPEAQRRIAAFKQALQELGWTDAQAIAFEIRFADGQSGRLAALAVDLVQANVDLIVTQAAEPIEAARKATNTIPIVMASVGDAVGTGIVASLAHPGGNVTGLTAVATEQGAKRLELMKAISPGLVRVAVLWNGNADGHRLQWKELERVAPALEIVLLSLAIRNGGEIDAALQAAIQAKAQALLTMDDPVIQFHRARIAEFARQQHLPVMGEFRSAADAGALMSYGPNQTDMWRRAAGYSDKILRGAKPADLPVQQPTKFELVINLRTARALELTVPPMLLALADEVIE
jgi:putative tryptophan/tyrosine transport system substrate-binding protein